MARLLPAGGIVNALPRRSRTGELGPRPPVAEGVTMTLGEAAAVALADDEEEQ